jgi:hypothetical protein
MTVVINPHHGYYRAYKWQSCVTCPPICFLHDKTKTVSILYVPDVWCGTVCDNILVFCCLGIVHNLKMLIRVWFKCMLT